MSEILKNLMDTMQIRVFLVTAFIGINFIVSVLESFKLKNFSFKKLPSFAGEWLMSVTALLMVELLLIYANSITLLASLLVGFREIVTVAILVCYFKKSLESLKTLGWSVKVSAINDYLDSTLSSASIKGGSSIISSALSDNGTTSPASSTSSTKSQSVYIDGKIDNGQDG